MRYRDARLLKEGDEVIRKDDQAVMVVHDAQAFGQYKTVKLICYLKTDESKTKLYYYSESIEDKNGSEAQEPG